MKAVFLVFCLLIATIYGFRLNNQVDNQLDFQAELATDLNTGKGDYCTQLLKAIAKAGNKPSFAALLEDLLQEYENGC